MKWLLLLIPLLALYYFLQPEALPIPNNAWEQAESVRDYLLSQGEYIPLDEVYIWITTPAR